MNSKKYTENVTMEYRGRFIEIVINFKKWLKKYKNIKFFNKNDAFLVKIKVKEKNVFEKILLKSKL